MVQDLLAQQQSLLGQLATAPKAPRPQKNQMVTNKRQSLQKKSSERVPRPEKVSFGGKTAGGPQRNQQKDADRQAAADARRRRQQEAEQERIQKIEAKIERARQRRGDEHRVKSQVARQTRVN